MTRQQIDNKIKELRKHESEISVVLNIFNREIDRLEQEKREIEAKIDDLNSAWMGAE